MAPRKNSPDNASVKNSRQTRSGRTATKIQGNSKVRKPQQQVKDTVKKSNKKQPLQPSTASQSNVLPAAEIDSSQGYKVKSHELVEEVASLKRELATEQLSNQTLSRKLDELDLKHVQLAADHAELLIKHGEECPELEKTLVHKNKVLQRKLKSVEDDHQNDLDAMQERIEQLEEERAGRKEFDDYNRRLQHDLQQRGDELFRCRQGHHERDELERMQRQRESMIRSRMKMITCEFDELNELTKPSCEEILISDKWNKL